MKPLLLALLLAYMMGCAPTPSHPPDLGETKEQIAERYTLYVDDVDGARNWQRYIASEGTTWGRAPAFYYVTFTNGRATNVSRYRY
jgi:hypothetical protein